MNRRFSVTGAVLGLLLFCGTLGAQSQADIELARQLARSQGYTEQQIDEMLKRSGGSKAAEAQTVRVIDRNAGISGIENGLAEYGVSGTQETERIRRGPEVQETDTAVFGHGIFRNKNLTFIPSYNIPTPENYRLSSGDEVVIDVWGATVTNITAEITPEGSITIPDLGPVYINGQTVREAEKNIKDYLSKIYSGISDPTPNTFVKLALGKIRSVTVNVLGEVIRPGSYTLPSLSTVASALYLAGGPSRLGTIRNIKVYRRHVQVGVFDVYSFVETGNAGGDIRLEDNDVIMVGPYEGIVSVSGSVKRPMRYEMKAGETLEALLGYAGGLTDKGYVGGVHIDRTQGPKRESFDVDRKDFGTFEILDGDEVSVYPNPDRYRNRVEISGAVWRPGFYSISDTVQTVKGLIQASGGLREDAYLQKGYIERYGEKREKEQVSFNPGAVLLGGETVRLMPDDKVLIFSMDSLTPVQTVSVSGEVNVFPEGSGQWSQKYPYRKGMTLGDVILMAGGPRNGAALNNVEVARRIGNTAGRNDSGKESLSDTIAVIMKFDLLRDASGADFQLEPFDAVFVRRSVQYKPQQTIRIEGEVTYPGNYVIEKNTVRLSDVIKRAEGVNKDAYVKGAKLTRILTREESTRLEIAMQIVRNSGLDTMKIDSLESGNRYYVGIDLEEALKHPGSFADVVLRDNDIITVPKLDNTVKISGGVYRPNTLAFDPRYKISRYISNAGGYSKGAVKRKMYMVHMNGSIARRGAKDFKVRPGTEIIVPMKDMSSRNRLSVAEVLGMVSSTASIAAMVVSITQMVK